MIMNTFRDPEGDTSSQNQARSTLRPTAGGEHRVHISRPNRSSQQPPRSALRQPKPSDPYTRPLPCSTVRTQAREPHARLQSIRVPDINMDHDRLLRACGHPPSIESPCTPKSAIKGSSADISSLPPAPKWPYKEVLGCLKKLLRAEGKNIKDYLDVEDVEAHHKADVEDTAARERSREDVARMRAGGEIPEWAANKNVFGAPLSDAVLVASTPVILSGARHELPIALYSTVEELYRTGIYQPGLFRDLPNRKRHMELIQAFDSAPTFGADVSLSADPTAVVAAVLSTFLKNISSPLLGEPLFEPIWSWVVRPTVQREEALLKHVESEEEDARDTFYRTGIAPRRGARREAAMRRASAAEEVDTDAETRVPIVQLLLRLLPTHRLSALYYICAFFSMVPLSPDNGLTLDDIARMFAQPLLGGPHSAARHILVWILRRWTRIAEGLLEADYWPLEPEFHPEDPEPWRFGDHQKSHHTRRGSSASFHTRGSYPSSEASTTLYSGSATATSDADEDMQKTAKARSHARKLHPIDWERPASATTADRHRARRASESCVRLPPLVFPQEQTETHVRAAGDAARASFMTERQEPLSGRRKSFKSGENESEPSLRAQLDAMRRERDEALRIVHTLRAVLGH